MEGPFRSILTVSELTESIKDLLEANFQDIWIEGEISNLRIPPSGHVYFTLKDESSQIRAVLFKMQARSVRFRPEDGLQVICRGRVSLYEKRGEYQIILDTIEPRGVGALQLAFLQLKQRLEKEGLFDADHKKTIPMLPQTIGLITSPTGAVIRDMLHIIDRRFANVRIVLFPVRVQGEGASDEISEAIGYFNERMKVDVIILGRGGGSIEDLWAFNEENLARAIYGSKIPIISAVGHETDYTISDFVADLRAPTPSAAAELVVRDKRELKKSLRYLRDRLEGQIVQLLEGHRAELSHLRKLLSDPRKRIEENLLRVDDLAGRLRMLFSWNLRRKKERHLHLSENLSFRNPGQRIEVLKSTVAELAKRLSQNTRHRIDIDRHRIKEIAGKLDSLSPLSILRRGYSITRKIPSLEIIKSADDTKEGEKVEVTLYQGNLYCVVERLRKS